MAAPEWAGLVLDMVAQVYKRKDIPTLVWRVSKTKEYTTGRTQFPKQDGRVGDATTIVITAGSDKMHQLYALVHECAHWLVGHRHAHDHIFTQRAFALFEQFGLSLGYCLIHECRYHHTAFIVAQARYRMQPALQAWLATYWDSGRRQNNQHITFSTKAFKDTKNAMWLDVLGY